MATTILSILERADRPLTAYAIQAQAADAGVPLYPTQIYRTVRRLVAEKRLTRIETANAYIIRDAAADMTAVCSGCGRAFPLRIGRRLEELSDAVKTSGFVASSIVVEAIGRCRQCMD